jgi:hypothetical protein
MMKSNFHVTIGRVVLCRESVHCRFGYDEAEAGYDMKRHTCALDPVAYQFLDRNGSTFPRCSDHSLFRY